MKRIIITIELCIILQFVTGCFIPIPHTSERFPPTCGRVLDTTTHAPVGGASLAIQDHPGAKVQTDSSGMFSFPRYRNYHLISYLNIFSTTKEETEVENFPRGTHWGPVLTVTHPDYQQQEVNILKHAFPRSNSWKDSRKPYELHDILLTPKPH
jgi:hypothetical protein